MMLRDIISFQTESFQELLKHKCPQKYIINLQMNEGFVANKPYWSFESIRGQVETDQKDALHCRLLHSNWSESTCTPKWNLRYL